jgi:hypothetical protein
MSEGTFLYKNGSWFEGKFDQGNFFKGKFQSRSGESFSGLFVNGFPSPSQGIFSDREGN